SGAIRRLSKSRLRQLQIYHILKPFPEMIIWYMYAKTQSPTVKKHIKLYFDEILPHSLKVNGDDLIKQGVTDGERIGQVLQKLFELSLEQGLDTRKKQMKILKTMNL
ncbi:MAG: hypothetical protein KC713_05250, partial [Candidatus Omnitrophica bacterium]|nr:hypothetical protein [Candidatus Omnitrophota bacterium]